ncbi:hypothetical protein J4V97_24220, partial [Escherichia coli]
MGSCAAPSAKGDDKFITTDYLQQCPVGHRGTLMLAAGGSLSGRTQLSKGASMVLNGDVVSTGDIVNA